MYDYEFKTTFWQDFTIADKFGLNAIKDTYTRAFNEWKTDKVYITELVLVLNWKIWEHHEKGDKEKAEALADECNLIGEVLIIDASKNLKGDDLRYYLQTTD